MSARTRPIPEGFHTVTPYLTVKAAAQAIDFYKRAFGAQERVRMAGPDGKGVAHAELLIGNSIVMLADEMPGCGNRSPQSIGGTPVCFAVYVEDVDAAFRRALEAGARVKQTVEDKFYGDRVGTVEDPFGHQWMLMTHIEDVSPSEMQRRMTAFLRKMPGASPSEPARAEATARR